MEINQQHHNIQQTTASSSSATAQVFSEQDTQANESNLNSVSTVNVSTEAQKLSTDTKASTASPAITNQEQAEESVSQFKKDAANDPVLAQAAQSHSLTSERVSRLIG